MNDRMVADGSTGPGRGAGPRISLGVGALWAWAYGVFGSGVLPCGRLGMAEFDLPLWACFALAAMVALVAGGMLLRRSTCEARRGCGIAGAVLGAVGTLVVLVVMGSTGGVFADGTAAGLTGMGAAGGLDATGGTAASGPVASPAAIVALSGACAMGLGFALLTLVWALRCADEDVETVERAVPRAALVCGVAVPALFALGLAHPLAPTLLAAVLPALSAFALVGGRGMARAPEAASDRVHPDPDGAVSACQTVGRSAVPTGTVRAEAIERPRARTSPHGVGSSGTASAKQATVASTSLLPVATLLPVLLVLGVFCAALGYMGAPSPDVADMPSAVAIASSVAGALLGWLFSVAAVRFAARVDFTSLFRWMAPLLIIAFAVSDWGVVALDAAAAATIDAILACLEVVVLLHYAALARRGALAAPTGAALGQTMVFAGLLAGSSTAMAIGTAAAGPDDPAFAMSFLVLVSLVSLAAAFLPEGHAREERSFEASAARDGIASAVDALAEAHGLSVREREVLDYLARGRSQPFIREELCLSKSTVATHVRHIYQKLDIHTRQELLDLVMSEQR